jgi:hypothetical protein
MNSLKTAIMALIVVAITVGVLWFTNRSELVQLNRQ